MKRTIIEIDEVLCTGCGQCVDACAEGAIQLVDGVARVVRDVFCDGLGACIGDCPEGALHIIERDAPAYDPAATEAHLLATRGPRGVERFHAEHEARDAGSGGGDAAGLLGDPHEASPTRPPEPIPETLGCGCPGSEVRVLSPRGEAPPVPAAIAAPSGGPGHSPAPARAPAPSALPPRLNTPELGQWPVQLHLVPPRAPFFAGRELVVLSTCSPVASADVHWRFLRDRACVVACPKLDRTEPYVDKLASILAANDIPRVLVVRMEVPCCGGLTRTVLAAARHAQRDDLVIDEVVVSTDGAVTETQCV